MEGAREARDRILEWGREIGFSSVGIAPAEPSPALPRLIRWLEEGRNGSMAYLARDPLARGDPRNLLGGCRSVICAALPYSTGDDPAAGRPELGRISRYAWGDDYHAVVKEKLEALSSRIRREWPEARARVAVDTSPIMEKALAAQAGIGWMGKHTLMIDPGRGSWFVLGEVLTTLALSPTGAVEDRCGGCSRCVEACPTGAIVEPYLLDARRCLSYWTIERKGEIDPEIEIRTGNWIFGCDVCQEVCPWNERAPRAEEPRFAPRIENLGRALREWREAGEAEFDRRFGGNPVAHVGRGAFLRNVEAAMRNERRR